MPGRGNPGAAGRGAPGNGGGIYEPRVTEVCRRYFDRWTPYDLGAGTIQLPAYDLALDTASRTHNITRGRDTEDPPPPA